MGSKADVEKKEAELIEELTAPTEQCVGHKRLQKLLHKRSHHPKSVEKVCDVVYYLLACVHV